MSGIFGLNIQQNRVMRLWHKPIDIPLQSDLRILINWEATLIFIYIY